ncbi:MAG: Bax inhibitor-1/YccA family protein [Lachnospiraceae bacterium]|nr:Bax inhibitor-1/YccA family protein [Lachnospiraceae bacterium]
MNSNYNRDFENPYFENENRTEPGRSFTFGAMDAAHETLSSYTASTFLWMALGLFVTFAVSFGLAVSGMLERLLMGGAFTVLLIAATIGELALVVILGSMIRKLSVGSARAMFLGYAALTGFTFSMYFYIFDFSILIFSFGAAALLFVGMAVASRVFNLELTSIRPYLFAGLIALLIFGLIGMFTSLGVFEIAVSYLGVAVFLGYTAYDTTKIRDNYYYYSRIGDSDMLAKTSVYSALQLYLDFINLFIYILRILSRNSGRRR